MRSRKETVETTLLVSEEDSRVLQVKPEKIEPNTKYTIVVSGLKDKDGNKIPDQTFELKTEYTPMYCSLDSLRMLVDAFEVPEDSMLSFIHTASQYADYVAGGKAVRDGRPIPYEVEEFTRTKAALDCLVRTFMSRSYSGGNSYKLDAIEYTDSVNSSGYRALLDALRRALAKWQDAIRGYHNEGRAKPKATRIGLKAASNTKVGYITVDSILRDITRTVPQWS